MMGYVVLLDVQDCYLCLTKMVDFEIGAFLCAKLLGNDNQSRSLHFPQEDTMKDMAITSLASRYLEAEGPMKKVQSSQSSTSTVAELSNR
jgi:hypothetical protein